MNMAHVDVMMAELTPETWNELANHASDDHAVLYRPEIHAHLAQISHMVYLAPGRHCAHGHEPGGP